LAAPSLQTPGDNEQIRQNDPTTGCAFSPTHGYGFQVAFTWTPVPEAVHYHLLLIHDGAQYPALDTQVDEPSYLMRFCNAYVIDANRFGWHWTATAVTEDGEDLGPSPLSSSGRSARLRVDGGAQVHSGIT